MDLIDLLNLKQWFSNYCRRFYFPDGEDQKNIALKELHTRNVSLNMRSIAGAVLHNRNKILIAEAIGLLHDVGRFPQYAQYKTFRDSISVNHGKLGAQVIEDENVLAGIPLSEREVIRDAVMFHNAFAVPEGLDPDTTFFLKMIRDADKLDIWRVFAEFYEKDVTERESAAGLGLPDTPEYSGALLSCLAEKRIASLADLRTLNDFRIMQLTWVYDLNFPVSCRFASERGMVDRIISTLPRTEDIVSAVAGLKRYMREKAAS